MIVGIAVETTVDSNDASAVTSTRATTTARRRRGSKRGVDRVVVERGGVDMEAESIECPHARPRRDERIQLQGVEGQLLSGGPSRRRDALVLRGPASRRRDQQHVLSDAEAGPARGLGGG